ncbi:phospholipid scramblase 1-like isoform X2 [Dicentrarchus labrax]|uniref:phospholipid scramblase 1-like isoform X2 n=1 Tax=Dicentrarchus labrax TaxID=13489 RepID=UPI0021F69035|nr:phospholipid scramblase 1-like isoform X2 [Dicentrarchus labrax]
MAYQGTTGPLPQDPVYYVGMQSGHNAVYSAPVGHGAADRPPYTLPTAPMMMPTPGRPVGCPPGLEYLTQTSQLLVHQRVEMAEIAIGWEMNNVYTVKNSMGQQVFVATEENDIFTMQELEVHSPPGNPIGYVEQNWHPGLPKFTILNEMRSPQLKIKGQWCDCSCMSDVIFEVMSLDESAVVGQISKQWGGFMQEGFTDADNFGISFPMDLDVKIKAVMVGACFLIDFMFFEKKPRNQH